MKIVILTGSELRHTFMRKALALADGLEVLAAVREEVAEDMLSHAHVAEFHSATYARQTNDEPTTLVKRILNHFIAEEHREAVLSRLMDRFFKPDDPAVRALYMTPSQIRTMQDEGMIIGSHSVTHPVFSKLPEEDQRAEVSQSFAYLDDVTGGLEIRNFAYPYGGFHTFTAATERILKENGCRFAFNVETRDVASDDLVSRPQAPPRWPCHHFPHGSAYAPQTNIDHARDLI